MTHSPEMHRNLIARIPIVTGRDLRDEHGLTHGYASAIVHEYALQRQSRLSSA